MPHTQPLGWSFDSMAQSGLPGAEKTDHLPEQKYLRTEQYSAWRATAIYGFVPFESPASRDTYAS